MLCFLTLAIYSEKNASLTVFTETDWVRYGMASEVVQKIERRTVLH